MTSDNIPIKGQHCSSVSYIHHGCHGLKYSGQLNFGKIIKSKIYVCITFFSNHILYLRNSDYHHKVVMTTLLRKTVLMTQYSGVVEARDAICTCYILIRLSLYVYMNHNTVRV